MKWSLLIAAISVVYVSGWSISLTVDNQFYLYVDGVLIGSGNDWTQTYTFSTSTDPTSIFIHGADWGVARGMILTTSTGLTSQTSTFKCIPSTADYISTLPGNWWELSSINTNTWPDAISNGVNGDSPWGTRPGISSSAQWIWSSTNGVDPTTGYIWATCAWHGSESVNLCATSNGGCDSHATCYGGVGGGAVSCQCANGYYSNDNGVTCIAVNACATANGGCDAHATCTTTLTTYDVTCTCQTGWNGPGSNGWYCAADSTGGGGGGGGGGSDPNWDCPATPTSSFDWRYPQPTCTSLTVFYPEHLNDESCQANDVNVKFHTDMGDFTLNFHLNDGCWNGQQTFTYATHPNWPSGLTDYSVVWVQVGGSNCHWTGDVDCGTPSGGGGGGGSPFDWNWEYPAPTCTDLVVTYPSNIPADQANDVNVRINTDCGTYTLNFHNNGGFWSGETHFDIHGHPGFPTCATTYTIVWVQVGGTNFHWEGSVTCSA